MTNPPLPPALPAPSMQTDTISALSLVSADLPPAELRALTNLIRKHITPLRDRSTRVHLIYAGPVRPGTAVPMTYRWLNKTNVSVPRILWEYLRPHSPLPARRSLRKLDSCAYAMCVSPDCFEVASIAMEAPALPDYVTQPVDFMRTMQSYGQERRRARVNMLDSARDRYIYRGQDLTIDQMCDCGCNVVVHVTIVRCDEGHIQRSDWAATPDGRSEMMGRQFRCGPCTRLANAARELRGSRPRAGYRPAGAAHNNIEREWDAERKRWWTDDLPREGPGFDAQRATDDEREYADMDRAIDELPSGPDE